MNHEKSCTAPLEEQPWVPILLLWCDPGINCWPSLVLFCFSKTDSNRQFLRRWHSETLQQLYKQGAGLGAWLEP